ncbi:MAG: glycosyltransferase [Patescibacteria group bacterium]
MAKKKLFLVVTKSVWGGAGRYVYDLATELSGTYDVAVVLGGHGPLIQKLKDKKIRIIPVRSLTRDIHWMTDIRAFFELISIFRRERPDIVHTNSSKAGALGALAGRIAGVRRVVFTIHGWAYNEPVSPFSKFFRWSASLVTILLAHRVIAVSHFDRVHSPLGLDVIAVHNGISPLVMKTREEARRIIRKKVPVPGDAIIIGTITEFTKNKGNDILIDAMGHVPRAHAVIIGGGEDYEKMVADIKAFELTDRVHLAGFITDASTLVRAFDIFVMPSRKEGLPYAILEAGAAGVAVVATTVGGIPEIIDDQISGVLVPAFDAELLAEALNDLVDKPNSRARYAEALKERVDRYFNLRGMIKKTTEVYEA